MPVKPPPFVPYPSPVSTVPAFTLREPHEGPRMVHCEVDWVNMGGPSFALAFDLSQNSPQNFTQIIALNVDNTSSSVDVRFAFPDTGSQLTVPAGVEGIYPVFTGQTKFYLWAISETVSSLDITTFDALNFLPPPVEIARSEQLATLSPMGVPINGTVQTAIITPAKSGILQGLNIQVDFDAPANFAMAITVFDGNSVPLWQGHINNAAGGYVSKTMVDMDALNQRFYGPLSIQVASSPAPVATSFVDVNAYIRTY